MMEFFGGNAPEHLDLFVTSLCIGLLLGMERERHDLDNLQAIQAVTSITLAILVNFLFKAGLIVSIGGSALARQTLPGLAAIGIGLLLGIVMLSS